MEIIYDLSLYGIPQLGKNQKSALVVSKSNDESMLCVLENLVQNLFSNKGFVFEVVGFSANLKEISDFLCSKAARYHEGDGNRLFIRKFPECLHVIRCEQFYDVMENCWSNAIHERRRIFFLEKEYMEKFMNTFDETPFSDYLLAIKTWEYIDIIIENVPDDPRKSFVIICKECWWNKIVGILLQE